MGNRNLLLSLVMLAITNSDIVAKTTSAPGKPLFANMITGGAVKKQIINMVMNGSGTRDFARVRSISRETAAVERKKRGFAFIN